MPAPPRPARPVGTPTRGTTAPNRLRRVDRWLVATHGRLLRTCADPLVVDLGYGETGVTPLELWTRVRAVRPDARVVGVEIDPARVAAAAPLARPGLEFVRGGFELPVAGDPVVVRALNVLRQYAEDEVPAAWQRLLDRLAPEGIVVEGTCDELGRLGGWVTLDRTGPRTLTLAARLAGLERPSVLAERLPKALIHRNVPGERVHALLADLDAGWDAAAAYAGYGRRQRWVAAVEALARRGWPVLDRPHRWRQGELTVAWDSVAPS
ncbi:hypothetical protein EV189_3047 [Motilibacter rhizosphaerae]|uniref:Methyltransferase family protein n=1 Tax=Motilibacter rhizosphaerae TaxID=598652 RepID=A0A4Q7NQU7_9ACTN|nr:class I SAM-dependent methyltransferase [Motilibacter rhizosphaerae]RZS87613.1 hypothetical protein EV189_3047 [Motilibacter rhizosphaerae]